MGNIIEILGNNSKEDHMIDLYTNLDLRLRWEQSNYFRKPKARNVSWEKARKSLDNRLFQWLNTEEW